MSDITITLLNWKRPANLRRLLDSLYAQTLRPRVFLWNNGEPVEDPRPDWVVQSSRNMRCWPRWLLGSMAETEYICSLDDDLALKDNRVLADLVDSMEKDAVRDRVYGVEGVIIPRGSPYRKGRRPTRAPLAPVDMLKGRMMSLHRDALATIGMLHGVTEDDITICGLLAQGREKHHREVGWLRARLEALPAKHALCHQNGHYERRDAAARRYLHEVEAAPPQAPEQDVASDGLSLESPQEKSGFLSWLAALLRPGVSPSSHHSRAQPTDRRNS